GNWTSRADLALPSRIMRRTRSTVLSSTSKYAYIGSTDTMVVSTVPPPWSPDWIRLPTVTTYRLTRPLTGAMTFVYSRSSWRNATTALSAAMLAISTLRAAEVLSRSDRDTAPVPASLRFRWYSASSYVSCASSWATFAFAWFSVA